MVVPLKPQLEGAVLHDQDGNPISSVLDGLIRRLAVDAAVAVAANNALDGSIQVQAVETVTPLAGSTTFTGAARDCITFESFGISVFITRGAVNTNVDVIVENSSDGGVTFREVDRVNLPVTPSTLSRALNRVYSVTRQHYRAKLINNTANALSVTELVTMRKPV